MKAKAKRGNEGPAALNGLAGKHRGVEVQSPIGA
jgi:hypothetical protein